MFIVSSWFWKLLTEDYLQHQRFVEETGANNDRQKEYHNCVEEPLLKFAMEEPLVQWAVVSILHIVRILKTPFRFFLVL